MFKFNTYFKEMNSDDFLFFFLAATFFLLPTRTSYPLVSIACASFVWLISGHLFELKSLSRQKWFLPVLFFILLPWVGLFYSKDLDLGIDYALKTKYWIAVFLMATVILNEKRIKIILRSFWISLFIGSNLSFLQYYGFIEHPKTGYLGFGMVYTVLSMYLLVGILTISFEYKFAASRGEKSTIIVFILAFLFHLTVLEGRNGYFVLILISPLVAHNLTPKRHISLKILIFMLLVGSLTLSPVVQKRIKMTIDQLGQKETIKEGQLDETFPRPFMFHHAIRLLVKNPVFGIGTGSLKYYTSNTGHAFAHPHNNILYMGVSFGMLGLMSLFWLFGKMFTAAWKNRGSPIGYFAFSICIVVFLGGFFDTLIINSGTSLFLPLGYGLIHHFDR